MLKVFLFLLVNTILFTNSASLKKNKAFYGTGGLFGLSNISTLGDSARFCCNRRIFDTNGAGNSNPYVYSYNAGLYSRNNLNQASPYMANLQGGGDLNSDNYPYTNYSGDNSSCSSNIANSYANSCNSNQVGNANAISNAYAQGTNNYILE